MESSQFRRLTCALAALFCLFTLAACSGIPVRSLPRLVKLQSQLLDANPAEFMVAIEADARVIPPPGASPILQIDVQPAETGAFEPIERRLPMRFAVMTANSLGLKTPSDNRRWLIYSLTSDSQAELARVQKFFRHRRGEASSKKGGTLSLGIAQDGVATKDPALAATRWESWLQVSRQEGFFELWSGSVAELLQHAKAARAGKGDK
jgi:hypothetical protein